MKEAALNNYKDLLLKHISNKRVSYVDVPDHFNFGDYLIYLGSREIIKNSDCLSCRFYTSSQISSNFNLISKDNTDVIICHGGGNFGDLYDRHNNIRLALVKKFQDIPIVLFPQTIFYQDKANMLEDFSFLEKHSNLSIFVRDFESKSILENNSSLKADICCDTAQFLFNTLTFTNARENKNIRFKKLLFKRVDKERVSNEITSDSKDWDYFFSPFDVFFKRTFNFLSIKLSFSETISRMMIVLWNFYMDKKLKVILDFFTSFEEIETDRLHGYILAYLLDVKRTALDNSYGKIARYIKIFKI